MILATRFIYGQQRTHIYQLANSRANLSLAADMRQGIINALNSLIDFPARLSA